MKKFQRLFLLPCLVGILLTAAAVTARADTTRTQTISLHQGWNSVFLQVTPAVQDPGTVFTNLPVTIAAVYLNPPNSVQYIQNPTSIPWKREGWLVWYAPSRPDSFLTSLFSIYGNKPYLIYCTQACTWTVTGTVSYVLTTWKANSYNLAGFSLDDTSPPTFDQFFSASTNHQPYQIFRLTNGQWTKVSNPVGTAMQSGEAFWIYCNGGSSYQGPLYAKLSSGQGVTFTSVGQTGILLANQGNNPMNVTVQTVANDVGVPLGYIMRGITPGLMADTVYDLPQTYQAPALEAGQQMGFWLTLRRDRMVNPVQSALLKFSTDSGVVLWIPVTGQLATTPQ